MSVLSVLEGKSSGVPIGTGPRLCLSPAVDPMGTGQQKNCVEATRNEINVNVRKKIYLTQNLVALVRIGGIWRRGDAVAAG